MAQIPTALGIDPKPPGQFAWGLISYYDRPCYLAHGTAPFTREAALELLNTKMPRFVALEAGYYAPYTAMFQNATMSARMLGWLEPLYVEGHALFWRDYRTWAPQFVPGITGKPNSKHIREALYNGLLGVPIKAVNPTTGRMGNVLTDDEVDALALATLAVRWAGRVVGCDDL